MIRLLYCCLLLFMLSSQKVLAETFIVTTTLENGPGSLRDAIEKANANGDRDQDFIYFNITRAREYVITIRPNNPLPALTSNITIDATTQPSDIMGVSNARIGVALEGVYSGSAPLYLFDCQQARNIKIFGLFMKGNLPSRPAQFSAVYSLGGSNIQIGAPEKGNVLSGWTRAIHIQSDSRFTASGITISSNIFGLDTDGISTTFGGRTGGTATNTFSIVCEKTATNVTIGGSNATFGNIFNSSNTDIISEGVLVNDGVTSIRYNTFGLDYNGENIIPATTFTSVAAIDISNINSYPNISIFNNPVISNNYIGGKRRNTGIKATSLQTAFTISNNTVGFEDRGGQPDRDANYGTGIIMRSCYNGKIKDNTIRYWQQGAILLDGNISLNVSTNSTYCNRKHAIEIRNWNVLTPGPRLQPFAYINRIEPARGFVKGKSLPDNIIELFYNETCPTCEGKTYFATITADANGDWEYTGILTGDNVIATAAEILFHTSEYSMPKVSDSLLNITPVTCSGGTGSICGLKILSGTKWRWENESGAIVGNDTCLRNVPAGRYTLKISIGSSCEESFQYTIPDISPSIDFASVAITPARCGSANGSICGIRTKNGVSWRWEDELGNAVSTNLCFNNARPGRYRLRLEGQNSCFVLSPLFDVPNKEPRINAANAVVVHPSCGRHNGSIRGIQLTDMDFATRAWYNDAGVLITNNNDLLNAAPGRYKLVVRDNSGACGDSTAYFTLIAAPPPTMNTSGAVVTDATCGQPNGSISGITLSNITGTTNYWWIDQAGQIVAITADLRNAVPGTYRLKVKDGSNCDTLFSTAYTITEKGRVQLDSSSIVISPTSCNRITGSITGMKINGATRLEWRNTSTGVVISNIADLTNIPAGTYQLTAFNDTYGCNAISSVYTINALPLPVLDESRAAISGDTCQFKSGRITGIVATSDIAGLQYAWHNAAGQVVGSTQQLVNVAAGDYFLVVTDGRGCTVRSRNYTIPAVTTSLVAPRYPQTINIERHTDARLVPQDNRNATYELYDRATGALIASNSSGVFILQKVPANREVYITYTSGPCTSGQTTVQIKVFDETILTIPNAFSPNNDGINDVFKVQVLGYFRLNSMKIFNRYGQLVHEVRDLNLPWDGRHNGNSLPVGTYYWIIDGIDLHNKPMVKTGSITLIR